MIFCKVCGSMAKKVDLGKKDTKFKCIRESCGKVFNA